MAAMLSISYFLVIVAVAAGTNLEGTSISLNTSACVASPLLINGQLAYGLYKSIIELCPNSTNAPVSFESTDPLALDNNEIPQAALVLGPNGTFVAANGSEVMFRDIVGTPSDVTGRMASNLGFSIVTFVRLNEASDGPLLALADDVVMESGNGSQLSGAMIALKRCIWTSANPCVNVNGLESMYVVVAVSGATAQIHVILSDSRDAFVFSAPMLFDGNWHQLGIVAEPMVGGLFTRVSLHIDGQDPFRHKFDECALYKKSRALPSFAITGMLSNLTVRSNTSRGMLVVGGASGSYHAVVVIHSALTRQAIAAFGTATARRNAAGGSKESLLAIGLSFIAAAVVLIIVALLRFTNFRVANSWGNVYRWFQRIRQQTDPTASCRDGIDDSHSTPSCANTDEHIQQQSDKVVENPLTDKSSDVPVKAEQESFQRIAKAATGAGAQAAQLGSAAAVAMSSMRATRVPAAAVVVSLASLSLQVPQQMTILLTAMSFPSVFQHIFGNFFDFLSIRFDFPEVVVPPYAPLILVLIGVAIAGGALVVHAIRDRQAFNASLERFQDRRAAYLILIRHIVTDVFSEISATPMSNLEVSQLAEQLSSDFPFPVGQHPTSYFDSILISFIADPEERAKVSKLLRSRCAAVLDVLPVDTVTTLCLCLVPHVKSKIVMLPDITAAARKLQSLNKSFNASLFEGKTQCFNRLVQDWSVAADGASYTEVLSRIVNEGDCGEEASQLRNLTEDNLIFHTSTFVRAVLGWVVDDKYMATFVRPFVEFFAERRMRPSDSVQPIAVATKGPQSGASMTSREAAMFQCVIRSDHDERAPPHNRCVPQRLFCWLNKGSSLHKVSAEDIFLELESRKEPMDKSTRYLASATLARCCPLHHATIVRGSEAHMTTLTLDGRPMYRCCNADLQWLKPLLHGKDHLEDDDCDGGTIFLCPDPSCAFSMCGRCLNRESGWVDANVRVGVATIVYKMSHMQPSLLSTLTLVLLESLLFPVTQIPLLVLTCSPRISCWLNHCYDSWNSDFVASFVLSVVLLILRFVVSVGAIVELNSRRWAAVPTLMASEGLGGVPALMTSKGQERWGYFVATCDRSLLGSMYVGTDWSCIAWGPLMKMTVDVGVVLAVCLGPADSASQKIAVGIVYAAQGIVLLALNPNLMVSVNILAIAVVAHQLLAIGLTSIHLGCMIDVDDNSAAVVMVLMIVVTFLFFVLVACIVVIDVVVPLRAAMWNFSMASLIHLDAQASLLAYDEASVRKRLAILHDSLHRKQKLCATTWQKMKALCGLTRRASSRSGSSQVAITAALIVQTVQRAPAQFDYNEWRSCAKVEGLPSTIDEVASIVVSWLIESAQSHSFFDVDASSPFSLSRRQLLSHESDALGYVLQHYCESLPSADDNQPHTKPRSTRVENHEKKRTVPFFEVVCKLSRGTQADGDECASMTHCNQLQMLAAAHMTEGLEFSHTDFRGCRLPLGTMIRSSAMVGCDFNLASLPNCSFVACDLNDTLVTPQSFEGTVDRSLAIKCESANSVVFLPPDGSRLVSGGSQGVCLWDASSGVLLHRFGFGSQGCLSVSCCLKGLTVACGSSEQVRILDIARCAEIQTLSGHTDTVNTVAISLDATIVASGSDDTMVRLWDVSTGVCLFVLAGHSQRVTGVAIPPDGLSIASVSFDRSIRVWSRNNGEAVFAIPDASTRSLLFSHDGRHLIAPSANRNPTLRMWDASSGSLATELPGNPGSVECMALSPDGGKRILTGVREPSAAHLWDAATGGLLLSFPGSFFMVSGVAFSPDGSRVAVASGHQIRLYDAASNGVVGAAASKTSVSGVALSGDGVFVAGGVENTLRMWSAADGAEIATFSGHQGAIYCVAFSPCGTYIASAGFDTTIRTWDLGRNREYACRYALHEPGLITNSVHILTGHTSSVVSVSYSPDGSRVVSACNDKTIRVWDLVGHVDVLILTGHARLTSATFSGDGLMIASGGEDNIVRLWDAGSGCEVLTLQGHSKAVEAVVFSPDCQLVASCSEDKLIKLWDTHDGRLVRELAGHLYQVSAVAFTPDGCQIVSCSYDDTLRVWHVATGAMERILKGHWHSVTCLSLALDGITVASVSMDETLRVWDISRGMETIMYCCSSAVGAVGFAVPNKLISVCVDGCFRVHDAENGNVLCELSLETVGGVTPSSSSLSPTSSHVLCCSANGSIAVVPTSNLLLDSHPKPPVFFFPRSSSTQAAFVSYLSCTSSEMNVVVVGDDRMTFSVLKASCPDNGEENGISESKCRGRDEDCVASWTCASEVKCLTCSASTAIVVSGHEDCTVRVWDATRGEEMAVLIGHNDPVISVSLSPDDALVGSGSEDCSVRLSGISSNAPCYTMTGHDDHVTCLSFSKSGQHLASGSRDGTIIVWDTMARSQLRRFAGHTDAVNSVAFAIDGRHLVSGSLDMSVRLWDVTNSDVSHRRRTWRRTNSQCWDSAEYQRLAIGLYPPVPLQNVLIAPFAKM